MADLRRSLRLWDGLAMVVGIMVGSGIFRTPGLVAAQLGRPWLTFVAWTAGGALAFLGALLFAELATRLPRAGGKYVYAREAFGTRAAGRGGVGGAGGGVSVGDLDVLRLRGRRQDRRGGRGPGPHPAAGVPGRHRAGRRAVPAAQRGVLQRAAAGAGGGLEPGRGG